MVRLLLEGHLRVAANTGLFLKVGMARSTESSCLMSGGGTQDHRGAELLGQLLLGELASLAPPT
jgi:hypothetical protein